jgi:CcmD family protein
MFTSLLPVAVIIILLWVGLFAYYIYVAQRQAALRDELESLEKMLREKGSGDE